MALSNALELRIFLFLKRNTFSIGTVPYEVKLKNVILAVSLVICNIPDKSLYLQARTYISHRRTPCAMALCELASCNNKAKAGVPL